MQLEQKWNFFAVAASFNNECLIVKHLQLHKNTKVFPSNVLSYSIASYLVKGEIIFITRCKCILGINTHCVI